MYIHYVCYHRLKNVIITIIIVIVTIVYFLLIQDGPVHVQGSADVSLSVSDNSVKVDSNHVRITSSNFSVQDTKG